MELTSDAFLGGRVQAWQPAQGFRAGLDSVTLAAAVPARAKEHICELGAGVGVAALCLAARVRDVHITAVEIDEDLAGLAQANATRNNASIDVVIADVLKRPRTLARQSFHHVMTNPPFHDIGRGTRAPEAAKARATSAYAHDLVAWLRFARALTRPKGTVTAILPPEQISLALEALAPEGKGLEIIPLWPKPGAPAKRTIIRIQMNAKASLLLHAGLVLNTTAGKPTTEAEAVLRHVQALIT
ncbi:MAG: methyltransferase [Alphaproteobacteria bacterium]|nr:methyltransferase [Alphaproteobacteria bacterium]